MAPELWVSEEVEEHQLAAKAKELWAILESEVPFVLALDGQMGAGKTAFVRAMLRTIGLDSEEIVSSPTYALMHEYEISGDWYAHLDLYRVGFEFNIIQLGVLDVRDFKGVFVEWAFVPPVEQQLCYTHRLKIEIQGPRTRRFVLESLTA